MKFVGGVLPESSARYALAGALLLGGPVCHYLYIFRYPLVRAEAIVLPAAAALLGVLGAMVARRLGGLLSGVVFGGLVFGCLDLQFAIEEWTYTAVVALTCVVVATLLYAHRATITSVSLGAFYLASLPQSSVVPSPELPRTAVPHRGVAPVLLHVILDEQWGIGGLRAAGDSASADALAEFYLRHGFEVYEAAYSRFQYSMESIPEVVSLGARPVFNSPVLSAPYWRSMARNPYFERLQELGYAVHVYQSTFLDFCRSQSAPVATCHVESGNSIANIGRLDGPWILRALMAARFFLNVNSHVLQRLHPEPAPTRAAIAGGALSTARKLRETLETAPTPGTAIFAHLLLPHRPFLLDSTCAIHSYPQKAMENDFVPEVGESGWRETMRLGAGQILCAHRTLGALIDALDATVGREGSIVIVHGDHGGRLLRGPERDTRLSMLTAYDLNSIFPTMLAVRRPNVPAALHPEPIPVQDVVWELAARGFLGQLTTEWSHFVRKGPSGQEGLDTLRLLQVDEMIWVRPPL